MHDANKEKKIEKELTAALFKTFSSSANAKKIDACMKKQGKDAAKKKKLPALDKLLLEIAKPTITKCEKTYFRYKVTADITGTPASPIAPGIRMKAVPKHMTSVHRDIILLAVKSRTPKDVNEWSTGDIIKWLFPILGDPNYIHAFKRQWVVAYHDIIEKAAKTYDLPVEVVGGVAYTEVGGDPAWADDVMLGLRKLDRMIPFKDVWSRDPDKTSFGDLSMQIRVAAKELGYDPAMLSDKQRELILDSLKRPDNRFSSRQSIWQRCATSTTKGSRHPP